MESKPDKKGRRGQISNQMGVYCVISVNLLVLSMKEQLPSKTIKQQNVFL